MRKWIIFFWSNFLPKLSRFIISFLQLKEKIAFPSGLFTCLRYIQHSMPTKCFPSETEVESENEQKLILIVPFSLDLPMSKRLLYRIFLTFSDIIYIKMQNTTCKKYIP
jgi:hypothetical protein